MKALAPIVNMNINTSNLFDSGEYPDFLTTQVEPVKRYYDPWKLQKLQKLREKKLLEKAKQQKQEEKEQKIDREFRAPRIGPVEPRIRCPRRVSTPFCNKGLNKEEENQAIAGPSQIITTKKRGARKPKDSTSFSDENATDQELEKGKELEPIAGPSGINTTKNRNTKNTSYLDANAVDQEIHKETKLEPIAGPSGIIITKKQGAWMIKNTNFFEENAVVEQELDKEKELEPIAVPSGIIITKKQGARKTKITSFFEENAVVDQELDKEKELEPIAGPSRIISTKKRTRKSKYTYVEDAVDQEFEKEMELDAIAVPSGISSSKKRPRKLKHAYTMDEDLIDQAHDTEEEIQAPAGQSEIFTTKKRDARKTQNKVNMDDTAFDQEFEKEIELDDIAGPSGIISSKKKARKWKHRYIEDAFNQEFNKEMELEPIAGPSGITPPKKRVARITQNKVNLDENAIDQEFEKEMELEPIAGPSGITPPKKRVTRITQNKEFEKEMELEPIAGPSVITPPKKRVARITQNKVNLDENAIDQEFENEMELEVLAGPSGITPPKKRTRKLKHIYSMNEDAVVQELDKEKELEPIAGPSHIITSKKRLRKSKHLCIRDEDAVEQVVSVEEEIYDDLSIVHTETLEVQSTQLSSADIVEDMELETVQQLNIVEEPEMIQQQHKKSVQTLKSVTSPLLNKYIVETGSEIIHQQQQKIAEEVELVTTQQPNKVIVETNQIETSQQLREDTIEEDEPDAMQQSNVDIVDGAELVTMQQLNEETIEDNDFEAEQQSNQIIVQYIEPEAMQQVDGITVESMVVEIIQAPSEDIVVEPVYNEVCVVTTDQFAPAVITSSLIPSEIPICQDYVSEEICESEVIISSPVPSDVPEYQDDDSQQFCESEVISSTPEPPAEPEHQDDDDDLQQICEIEVKNVREEPVIISNTQPISKPQAEVLPSTSFKKQEKSLYPSSFSGIQSLNDTGASTSFEYFDFLSEPSPSSRKNSTNQPLEEFSMGNTSRSTSQRKQKGGFKKKTKKTRSPCKDILRKSENLIELSNDELERIIPSTQEDSTENLLEEPNVKNEEPSDLLEMFVPDESSDIDTVEVISEVEKTSKDSSQTTNSNIQKSNNESKKNTLYDRNKILNQSSSEENITKNVLSKIKKTLYVQPQSAETYFQKYDKIMNQKPSDENVTETPSEVMTSKSLNGPSQVTDKNIQESNNEAFKHNYYVGGEILHQAPSEENLTEELTSKSPNYDSTQEEDSNMEETESVYVSSDELLNQVPSEKNLTELTSEENTSKLPDDISQEEDSNMEETESVCISSDELLNQVPSEENLTELTSEEKTSKLPDDISQEEDSNMEETESVYINSDELLNQVPSDGNITKLTSQENTSKLPDGISQVSNTNILVTVSNNETLENNLYDNNNEVLNETDENITESENVCELIATREQEYVAESNNETPFVLFIPPATYNNYAPDIINSSGLSDQTLMWRVLPSDQVDTSQFTRFNSTELQTLNQVNSTELPQLDQVCTTELQSLDDQDDDISDLPTLNEDDNLEFQELDQEDSSELPPIDQVSSEFSTLNQVDNIALNEVENSELLSGVDSSELPQLNEICNTELPLLKSHTESIQQETLEDSNYFDCLQTSEERHPTTESIPTDKSVPTEQDNQKPDNFFQTDWFKNMVEWYEQHRSNALSKATMPDQDVYSLMVQELSTKTEKPVWLKTCSQPNNIIKPKKKYKPRVTTADPSVEKRSLRVRPTERPPNPEIEYPVDPSALCMNGFPKQCKCAKCKNSEPVPNSREPKWVKKFTQRSTKTVKTCPKCYLETTCMCDKLDANPKPIFKYFKPSQKPTPKPTNANLIPKPIPIKKKTKRLKPRFVSIPYNLEPVCLESISNAANLELVTRPLNFEPIAKPVNSVQPMSKTANAQIISKQVIPQPSIPKTLQSIHVTGDVSLQSKNSVQPIPKPVLSQTASKTLVPQSVIPQALQQPSPVTEDTSLQPRPKRPRIITQAAEQFRRIDNSKRRIVTPSQSVNYNKYATLLKKRKMIKEYDERMLSAKKTVTPSMPIGFESVPSVIEAVKGLQTSSGTTSTNSPTIRIQVVQNQYVIKAGANVTSDGKTVVIKQMQPATKAPAKKLTRPTEILVPSRQTPLVGSNVRRIEKIIPSQQVKSAALGGGELKKTSSLQETASTSGLQPVANLVQKPTTSKSQDTELHIDQVKRRLFDAPKMVDNKVHAPKIVDNKVHAPKIVDNRVHAPKIVNNEVHAPKIVDNKVHAPKIVDNKVHAPKMVGNKVHAPKIVNNEVHAPKMVDNEVDDEIARRDKEVLDKMKAMFNVRGEEEEEEIVHEANMQINEFERVQDADEDCENQLARQVLEATSPEMLRTNLGAWLARTRPPKDDELVKCGDEDNLLLDYPDPAEDEQYVADCKNLMCAFASGCVDRVPETLAERMFFYHFDYLKAVVSGEVFCTRHTEFNADYERRYTMQYADGCIIFSVKNLSVFLYLMGKHFAEGTIDNRRKVTYFLLVLLPELITKIVMGVYKIGKFDAIKKRREIGAKVSDTVNWLGL